MNQTLFSEFLELVSDFVLLLLFSMHDFLKLLIDSVFLLLELSSLIVERLFQFPELTFKQIDAIFQDLCCIC